MDQPEPAGDDERGDEHPEPPQQVADVGVEAGRRVRDVVRDPDVEREQRHRDGEHAVDERQEPLRPVDGRDCGRGPGWSRPARTRSPHTPIAPAHDPRRAGGSHDRARRGMNTSRHSAGEGGVMSVSTRSSTGPVDRRPAQFVRRRLPRLDDGRVRLLPRRPRLRRDRQGLRRPADPDGVPDHGHPAHAAGGRVPLRAVGRPGRAADAAHRRRLLLQPVRLPLRVRAELRRPARAAPAVRHRHGRRVGSRRGARDGEDPDGAARVLLRACCRRGTRSGTCSPAWRSCSCTNVGGLSLAVAVRAVDHPRADQPGRSAARVRESEVWEAARERQRETRTPARAIFANPAIWRRFVYLVLLMTAFNWMSHGTQDIYPTFLKEGLGIASATRDRGSSSATTSARSSAAPSSARSRSASAGAA